MKQILKFSEKKVKIKLANKQLYLPIYINKKKLKSLDAVSLILIFMLPADAQAQLRQQVTKNFGIGAKLGEPTGVTVKVWSGINVAFDVGGAWSDRKSVV